MSVSRLEGGRWVPTRVEWQTWLVLAALTVTAVVYLATIDRYGLWVDEIKTARTVRLPFAGMVDERLDNGHPPLFFALSWMVVRTISDSDAALRLLPALFGLTSAWLLFSIGRHVATATAGALGAVLLLTTPQQIDVSHMARNYTMVQALLLAATLALVRDERDSWRRAALYLLPATLAAWTHFSSLPVIGVQTVALAATRRWRAASAGALTFVLATPFLLIAGQRSTLRQRLGWIGRTGPNEWFDPLTYPFVRGRGALGDEALLVAVAVAVVVLGLIGASRLRRGRTLLVATWLGPPLVVGVGFLTGLPPAHEVARYFATSWAICPLLIGVAVVSLRSGWRVVAAAVAALLAVVGLSQVRVYLERGWRWPAREVARIVSAEAGENEVLLLRGGEVVVRHYYAGAVADLVPTARVGRGGRRRPATSLDTDVNGVWMYLKRGRALRGGARARWNALQERFPEIERRSLSKGTLVHMWREAPPEAAERAGE